MKIKEGEEVFGRPWEKLTEQERHEYVSVLEPDDFTESLAITWGIRYSQYLSHESKAHIAHLLIKV